MDSKTRHELEKNELSKWLTHQYEDWIRPNKSWLGYAVLGVIAVIVVIFATARVNARNQNGAWKHFYSALSSPNANAELELVAGSTSGAVGVHARLALAQRQLADGNAEAFIDKSKAIALLEKAITTFQQVQKSASDSMILQQAGCGLGECWETLAAVRVGDDRAKAEEEYQKVTERWENGFMRQRAQERLARIRQPATKMFLENMAAKVPEMPAGMEGFNVSINPDDAFFPGGGLNLEDVFGQGTPPETQSSDPEPEQKPEEVAPAESTSDQVE